METNPETAENITTMSSKFKEAMQTAEPPAETGGTPPATPPVIPSAAPPAEPSTVPPAEPSAPESRSSKDFKLIKSERDESRAASEAALSKVTDLEAKLSLYGDYDKIQAENKELNDALSVSNLENHPQFKEQFVKPIAAQIDRALAYVPEGARDQVAKILLMPIGEERANALDAATGELAPSRLAYIQSAVNRIDEIVYERDGRVKESKESYEQLLKEEQQVSEAKGAIRNKELEKTFDTTLKEAQENISVFQLREGDEEWNTGVRERVALAKNILLEQNTFEDAATAALWAASGGAFLEQNTALVEHNRRLTEELSKLKGAEPNPARQGGGAPSAAAGGNRPTTAGGFTERVLGEMRS